MTSKEWVNFKYSTNGVFWKKVYTAEYDILDNYYYIRSLLTPIKNADEYINKFKSVEDIKQYEKEQYEYAYAKNKQIDEYNNQKANKIKEIYKRLG